MCVNRIPEAYEENRPCSRVLKSFVPSAADPWSAVPAGKCHKGCLSSTAKAVPPSNVWLMQVHRRSDSPDAEDSQFGSRSFLGCLLGACIRRPLGARHHRSRADDGVADEERPAVNVC